MSNRRPRAVLAILIAVCLVPSAARAQGTPVGDPDDFKGPLLGGHVFSPVTVIPDPFIRTHLRLGLGMGTALGFEFPIGVIDGDTLTSARGDLLFALLDIEYQQEIKDWLAVRGRFRVLGRLGDGTQALLVTGITAATAFELGWLFKLKETRNTLLSLDAGVSNNNFTSVNVLKFVEDVIAGDPNASLVRKSPSVRGFGGLRLAWALSDIFGFTGYGRAGYGESVSDISKNEWFFSFGGMIDANLGARTAVPISFALGYSLDTFPEAGEIADGALSGVVFRVGYTGRDDLALGLTFSFESFPTTISDQRMKFSSTSVNLRYYF